MGLNRAFPSAAANMKGRKKAFQRAFTKSGISLLLIALLEGGTCHSSAQRPTSLPVPGLARAPTSPPSLQSSSFRRSLLVTAENKTQRKHSLPVAAICVVPPPPQPRLARYFWMRTSSPSPKGIRVHCPGTWQGRVRPLTTDIPIS